MQAILDLLPSLRDAFIEDYKKSPFDVAYDIEFEVNAKYVRIWKVSHGQRSCNGFVCLKDVKTKTADFKAGDLLKCATWKAPAMNFARGTIFCLDVAKANGNIRWTGIA